MTYNIIEFIEFIESEILFNQLEIKLDSNIILIELVYSDEINSIKKFLSDEFSSESYEISNKYENEYEIKFNDKIEYIDEDEYIENLKNELDEYESRYKKIFDEILSESDEYEY